MPANQALLQKYCSACHNNKVRTAGLSVEGLDPTSVAGKSEVLEPFRDQVLVISNLAQINGRSLADGGGDHARAGATWLTGVHPKKTEGADIHAGISADQVAARVLGKQTQFASLEIGVEAPSLAGGCDSGYSCAYTNTTSWRSPTTPNPMEVNPRVLFEQLFGDGDSTDPAARLASLRETAAFSIS